MKKIFAKLKNDQHVLVFDDADTDSLKDLYKVPDITKAVPFEVNVTTLVEGQWYFAVLTEEEKEEMLAGYLSESGSIGLDAITPDHYAEVAAVYMVSGEDKLFTKITSRHVSKPKKYLTFNEKAGLLTEQGNSILLTGEVDAYWNGRALYFKKFAQVRPLFPGIQKLYKDLTEKATNEFLSSALFELREEMSSDFIGLRNRKRIASIIEGKNIDLADPETHEKYLEYAKAYDLGLEIEEGKIALAGNADISAVINLFGESFYTAEITREKREVRTSRKLVKIPKKKAR